MENDQDSQEKKKKKGCVWAVVGVARPTDGMGEDSIPELLIGLHISNTQILFDPTGHNYPLERAPTKECEEHATH